MPSCPATRSRIDANGGLRKHDVAPDPHVQCTGEQREWFSPMMQENAAGFEPELEQACCPMCESAKSEPTPYGEAPFALRRCSDCRLWFLSPRLPETDTSLR